ncbi:MAG: type IV pilus assembly protein PilM [Fimbriimonadaceae bacterium]
MGLNPFAKTSYVGVDVGHHNIKVAQLEKTSGGFRVSKYGTCPTPVDAVKDGIVVDTASAGAALKQLLRATDIRATIAVVAVSGGSVVVRPARVPKMNEATLRKSIKFEAGRYVPTSAEDSFIEFEIIGDADDMQMDVLIVAAPREAVESRIAVCDFAGLEVDCVDLEPFAAYRSLIESDPNGDWHNKTIALVDIGGSATNLSVVAGGIFAMARSLPHGGQTLTEALKTYFRLSTEDAESGKAQLDLRELTDDTPKENPPLRVVQPHIDDLVREIRRSLNYFQSGGAEGGPQGKAVETVVLCGGGSKLPGIAEYLSHKLGMPAVSLGIYDNTAFTSWDEESGKGLELGVVAGLALRPFAKAA